MRNTTPINLFPAVLFLMLSVSLCYCEPIDTSFTYQGQLKELGEPAMGLYDFIITLYDAEIDGDPIGDALLLEDVVVSNGLFSVLLDFGEAPFDGNLYWLEIDVKPIDANDFTTLTPRQEINPAPYAVYAKTAGNAGDIADVIKGTGTANYIARFLDPNTLIESLIYESGGNIGIGTTSPDEKLHVVGNIWATGALIGTVDWTNLTSVPMGLDDGDDNTQLSEAEVDAYVANNGFLDSSSALDWDNITIDMPAGFADGIDNVGSGGDSDWTISGDDMYSAVPGNVGIGAISPTAKLEVNGTAKATAFVGDGSGLTNLIETDPTVDANVKDGVSWFELTDIPSGFADGNDDVGSGEDFDWTILGDDMYSAVPGNVGIGTTSPSEILDVNGNTHISGNLTVDGSISSPGTSHGSQEFTSSGTFTVPVGVTRIYITLIGGGGGGGASNTWQTGAPGGGSGAWCWRLPYDVTPGQECAVVIGSGGSGGIGGTGSSGEDGASGVDSTFDGNIIAGAGGGGQDETNGTPGAGGNISVPINGVPAGAPTGGGKIYPENYTQRYDDGRVGGIHGTGSIGGGGGGSIKSAGASGGLGAGLNGSNATANTGTGGGGSGGGVSDGGNGASGWCLVEWNLEEDNLQ